MNQQKFSTPVASDALSAIIHRTSCISDEGEPYGCRDANGDWKLSIYAQKSSEDPNIILSSSSLCTSGFMPVLTKTYLDQSGLEAGIFSEMRFRTSKFMLRIARTHL